MASNVVPLNNVNEYLVVHRQVPNMDFYRPVATPGRGRPMRRFAAALPWLALCAGLPAAAQSPGDDPLTWLQRAAASARQTTYAGTVMHVQGERTTTSRITHVFVAGAEHERIESLDGPRREIVRRNDELQCYFPDAKTVRLDRRVTARFFPSLVGGPAEAIAENYKLTLGNVERVLGQDCQWIHLDPKDALRYAQRLCAELGSGLLLRAKTLGARQQVIEQYTFTDLRVGRDVSRSEVKSTFQPQSKDWTRDVQPRDEAKPGADGLDGRRAAAGLPPGGRDAAHAPQPRAARLAARPHRRLRDHERVRRAHVEPAARAPRPRARTARCRSSSARWATTSSPCWAKSRRRPRSRWAAASAGRRPRRSGAGPAR